MKNLRLLKSLKHILVVIGIVLLLIFWAMGSIFQDISALLNSEFVYRTGSGTIPDKIYKHTLAPSPDIAIIRIDEASVNALQAQWNLKMLRIPKSVYVDLVEKLEAAWVKGIAFDIIFQNADPDEELFASTLSQYDNIVIAGNALRSQSCSKDATGSYLTCEWLPRSVYSAIPLGLVDIESSTTERYARAVIQVPNNGDARSFSLVTTETLPLKLYSLTHPGEAILDIMTSSGEEQKVLNTYFWWWYAYRSYSLKNLLVDDERFERIFAKEFQGKYVFIGESWTAIHDTIMSPATGELMDGVELHAHFLDWLLQNKMLTRVPTGIIFIVLVILTAIMVGTYFFAPKFLSPIIVLVSFVVVIWLSRYLYDKERVLVDVFPLFLAGILPYMITYIYKFFVVDREKRELQNNFGHYIDPHVVQEIAERDEPIELGGERRELSVLFSDIAGFTTISEKLADQPQDLFYLMTSYLSNMTDILIHEGGTLDKYIGDAVMGFFGAPVPHADHAIRACRTALFMRDRLPEFNADITVHGLEAIDFRVGIATGEVMVGNIGSHDRFNYTVLGDTVNLASRLEGTGKEYDVHIIISEWTRLQIGQDFFVRELDTIAVKGKHEWVRIYELVGFYAKVSDKWIYTKYEQALALYRTGKYHEAGEIWATQMEVDPPSRVMVERCMAIVRGEVMVENGIFHMTHK